MAVFLLLAAALLLPSTALTAHSATVSEQWAPAQSRVVTSENGRYAVALEVTGGGVRYALVRRRTSPGPPSGGALRDQAAKLLFRAGFDAPHVLGAGSLGQVPLEVLVSGTGHGFAALDRHGPGQTGKALVTVNGEGIVQGNWTLRELLGDEVTEGKSWRPWRAPAVFWRQGCWIDEESGQLFAVGMTRVFVAELASPGLRAGGVEDVLRGLTYGGVRGKVAALKFLAMQGLPQLSPRYAELLGSEQPLPVRLRAGWALALLRDRRAADLFLDVALNETSSEAATPGDRAFALDGLHLLAGVEILPRVREAMRGPADRLSHARRGVFIEFGEASVPILLDMLGEEGESPDYRGSAAHALGEIGSAKALDGLLAAARSPVPYVANAALNAALRVGAEAVAPRLLPLLSEGTTQTSRLASYFSRHVYPPSIDVLEGVLAGTSDESLRRSLERALTFQRKHR